MTTFNGPIRPILPIKWVIACIVAWSLFAGIMSLLIFIINPIPSDLDKETGIPELSGVSTVLIGTQSSYLRFDQSEVDCQKQEQGNTIQCQSMFENELLIFTVTRRTLGSNGSYTGHCQGVYGGRSFTCLPIPGKSRNVIPVTIDGQLGLSDERWTELYRERGYELPNFDLEGLALLAAPALLSLFGLLIWRQERKEFIKSTSDQNLPRRYVRIALKIIFAIFMVCGLYLILLLLAWQVEDFLFKL